ncbi:glutamate 5-kinase [Anoxynatronum buryatiense]|uniref:Glutamate 5-kinase n=1 Tax=Anoxynatronum buryatiense TaxID=489973 RepID=A0AA46AHW8_9CLOT|nr:glutamate 5-kinase [Anoxynatronum buryatiense]SMP43809.1 glutamate 5-kinase [Anoxynatronum buryatiense]
MNRKERMQHVKRIVIKVGTSTITHGNGLLNLNRMELLVRQIADLHNQDYEVVLVSSGSIGAGIGRLNLKKRPNTIPEKQVAAAVGQGILIHMYEKLFSEYGKVVAQILLTKEDIHHRTRFLHVRNAFFSLLEQGVVPIVNENDAIAVDEIKLGDNDTLSAIVSSIAEADLLILLSDIDGLCEADPRVCPGAKLIHTVSEITPEIEKLAGGAGSSLGTGGMITKINAARIATTSGTAMVIVNGSTPGVIQDVIDGHEIGTWFQEQQHPLQARKHWIAFGSTPAGRLVVDDGAVRALTERQKSLLPSGVLKTEERFREGQIVSIVSQSGVEVARGVTNYSSMEIDQIKGLKSSEIIEILGYKPYDEVIHRNNLVVLLH